VVAGFDWLAGAGMFDLLIVQPQRFPIKMAKFSEVGAILAGSVIYECY
jgi:hypothetical protein